MHKILEYSSSKSYTTHITQPSALHCKILSAGLRVFPDHCVFRGDHGRLWRQLAGTSALCSDHTEELWPWKEKYGAEDSGRSQIYLRTTGGICWYIPPPHLSLSISILT